MKISPRKITALILSASMLSLFGTAEYYSEKLPVSFMTDKGQSIKIAAYPNLSCKKDSRTSATVSLFGAVPVKNIEIDEKAFDDLSDCTLFVPIGTGYAYRHDERFKVFKEVKIEN